MVKNQETKELFGINLRSFRKLKRLKQADLAQKVGVAPNTISNYENGVSTPDFGIIDLIVKELDITREDLFNPCRNQWGQQQQVYPEELQEQEVDQEHQVVTEEDPLTVLNYLEDKYPQELPMLSRLKSAMMQLQTEKVRAHEKVIRLLEDKERIYGALDKLLNIGSRKR